MRVFNTAWIVVLLAWAGIFAATGATLEDRSDEWNLTVEQVDIDNVSDDVAYSFEWQRLLSNGRYQVGLSATSFDPDFDEDDPGLPDVDADGWSIGPTFTWNWASDNDLTGYLSANVSSMQGDFGDVFDASATAVVGLKWLLGSSFGIRAGWGVGRLLGADDNDDQDFDRMFAGVSFYTGK